MLLRVINLDALVLSFYKEAQCAARDASTLFEHLPGLAAALQTVFVKYR